MRKDLSNRDRPCIIYANAINLADLKTSLEGTILENGGMFGTIAMLVVMLAIFYFMLIRPENKKKKELAKLRSELAVGDEITTIGGIIGTICAVKEESIVIETSADRVRMEFAKWAISTKGAQTTENTK